MSNKLIDLNALSSYKTQSDLKYQDKLTAGSNISISNNTISAIDTTYSDATTASAGLMSSADKTKLDGLTTYSAGTGIAISTAGVISVSYPNIDNQEF